jgi:membrane protein YqaA with SNARE-associated domain
MNIIFYIFVFAGSFLVDIIPFVGPPAWTVMVFLQLKYNLNIWTVLLIGVAGSALGRYVYSVYIKRLSDKYLKEQKNADLLFIGSRLARKRWNVQLFVLLYTLMPVPTTPLFTASGVAGIRPLHIMPAFFTGKFASDALMISTGNYVMKNLSSISHGLLNWHTLLGTGVGLLLIGLFFFIDWGKLLIEKKLSLSFRIWK